MPTYTVIVPPTKEQGSYKTSAATRADALWDYNSCRAHDGLPPVSRMPAGTQYISQHKRKTRVAFIIQGNYGIGWEDENEETTPNDARRSLREYRENGPGSYRMIRRRVPND